MAEQTKNCKVIKLPAEFHTHTGRFDPIDTNAAWRNGFSTGFVLAGVIVTLLFMVCGR